MKNRTPPAPSAKAPHCGVEWSTQRYSYWSSRFILLLCDMSISEHGDHSLVIIQRLRYLSHAYVLAKPAKKPHPTPSQVHIRVFSYFGLFCRLHGCTFLIVQLKCLGLGELDVSLQTTPYTKQEKNKLCTLYAIVRVLFVLYLSCS